ncbi:MAG: HAD hydrolase family protein [archaeon]
MKIKGIILDIDGVIVGSKMGINSPSPHPDVVSALKKVKSKGIFISLCTAKPQFAIRDIIEDAGLDNLHITEGGGVIIDPIDDVVLKTHFIDPKNAINLLDFCLKNNIYVEFYTITDYFIQKSQSCDITSKHFDVLQQKAKEVYSLLEAARENKITKIVPIAKDEEDKKKFIEILKPFEKDLMINWTVHPLVLPLQFGIITAKGISKKNGAEEIVNAAKVKFDEMLGVGDSISDWRFIQFCGYGATLENAKNDLKEHILSKGKEFSYVGPSVDKNGIIDVFKNFDLL